MMYGRSVSIAALLSYAWCWSPYLQQQALLVPSTNQQHLHLTHDLFNLLKNLTDVESISHNEGNVVDWLASSLRSQGYQVDKQMVNDDSTRFNLLAWPGKNRDAETLLTSHIDTVPPFYAYKFDEDSGKISGRGTVDAKGSVATQIIAVNSLLSTGSISPDDVALLYVVGEEVGGDGMRAANDLDLKPKAIIFGEPTEGKLVSGHKGHTSVKLRAKGKAAHSGYPWLGRSANEILLECLVAVKQLEKNLPESEKYGQTTINIGRIDGGLAGNVVAENAMALITFRIAAGSPTFIREQLTKTVRHAVKDFLEGDMEPKDVIEIEWQDPGYGPVDIDHDVPGFDTMTVNYGTDIPNLNMTVDDQRRYLYGPGSVFVAHSDHEMLDVEDLTDAVEDYKRIILHALSKSRYSK